MIPAEPAAMRSLISRVLMMNSMVGKGGGWLRFSSDGLTAFE